MVDTAGIISDSEDTFPDPPLSIHATQLAQANDKVNHQSIIQSRLHKREYQNDIASINLGHYCSVDSDSEDEDEDIAVTQLNQNTQDQFMRDLQYYTDTSNNQTMLTVANRLNLSKRFENDESLHSSDNPSINNNISNSIKASSTVITIETNSQSNQKVIDSNVNYGTYVSATNPHDYGPSYHRNLMGLLNGYYSDSSDSDMPGMVASSDDGSDYSASESESDQFDYNRQYHSNYHSQGQSNTPLNHTHSHEYVDDEKLDYEEVPINQGSIQTIMTEDEFDLNLLFDINMNGLGKSYISGSSAYPPQSDESDESDDFQTCTFVDDPIKLCDSDAVNYNGHAVLLLDDMIKQTSFNLSENKIDINISDTQGHTRQLCSFNTNDYILDNTDVSMYEALYSEILDYQPEDKVIQLDAKPIRWWIYVPVRINASTVVTLKMLADSGANHPVCRTEWALTHFRQFVEPNGRKAVLNTPNGPISPKFKIHLLFPTKSGLIIKVKFFLVDDLPVNLIADLNMLIKFGYKFQSQVPPIFKHDEEIEPNLQVKQLNDTLKLHEPVPYDGNLLENKEELMETILEDEQKHDLAVLSTLVTSQEEKRVARQLEDDLFIINENRGEKKIWLPEMREYHGSLPHTQNEPVNVFCTTFHDYAFNKLCNDAYLDGPSQVNYIGNISHAQDIWVPLANDTEKQIYCYGKDTQTGQCGINSNGTSVVMPINEGESLNLSKLQPKDDLYKHFGSSVMNDILNTFKSDQNTASTNKAKVKLGIHSLVAGVTTYKQKFAALKRKGRVKNDAKISTLGKSGSHARVSRFVAFNKRKSGGTFTSHKISRTVLAQNTYSLDFIMMKESFKATKAEMDASKALKSNKKLDWIDFSYLKEIEKMQPRFKGLYDGIQYLCHKYRKIFAWTTYMRRTMRVKPQRLGIKEDMRNITCYRAQYPLTVAKRLWMIEYTKQNDANGYWATVSQTLHCIPYLMIPKRNRDGIVDRYRPAFDARIVNDIIKLMPIHMPTMRDIDELYSIYGLFSIADMKNMFDCIPLFTGDQPYSTIMSPMGLRRMMHLAYGFKNSPFSAQNIVNAMSMYVGNMLVYIDDITMKHHWHWDAGQHLAHIERLFKYCEDKNMLLNPRKFFPFISKCTSFGFLRTLDGSTISDVYKSKVLAYKRPETVSEMKEFLGVLGYISRYVYNGSMIQYWLNQLIVGTPEKRGKLKWNDAANIAFQQIRSMVTKAPILRNPTRDGEFMVKTDACMTGTGAVLFQKQWDNKLKQDRWFIVDMYSQQMPKDLRKAHSTIHEARAIVQAFQHWHFYLLKRKFTVYTDNQPIARLFTNDYRDLNESTQAILIRLRVAIAPFTFEIKHVKGVENELADALSRDTIAFVKTFDGIAVSDQSKDQSRANKSWLSYAKVIHSPDTKIRDLNESEEKQLDSYLAQITQQNMDLNHSLHDCNSISSFYNLVNISNKYFQNDSKMKELKITNQSQLLSYLAFDEYKNQLSEIKHNQMPDCYSGIATFLDYASHAEKVLAGDESTFTPAEIDIVVGSLNTLIINASKLSKSKLKQFAKVQSELYDVSTLYAYDLFQNGGESNNKVQKGSNKVTNRRHKMKLRSHSKEDRAKQTKRVDYIHPKFDDINERMSIRSNIMDTLFGHREQPGTFNINKLKQAQLDDSVLSMVISIIKRCDDPKATIDRSQLRSDVDLERKVFTNEFKFLIEDFSAIEALDPQLAMNIVSGALYVGKDGILTNKIQMHNGIEYAIVIPANYICKMMDYAHHNIHNHHLNWQNTFNILHGYYWWTTMRRDIRIFVKRCLLCAFANGTLTARAPMSIRTFVLPRESLFADFLELQIHSHKYHVLVMIDYCSGWTCLIPTNTNDAYTAVDLILRRWIPLHGQFKYFDSDRGAGFIGRVLRILLWAFETDVQYVEANHHRGIGKVERTIRMVQSAFRKLNLQLNQSITDEKDSEHVFNILQTVLPHMQAAINQRRPRFTTFSPNMLMFGTRIKDISNMDIILKRLKEIYKDTKNYGTTTVNEYDYIQNLLKEIGKMYKLFHSDWQNYVWQTKAYYNRKHKVTKKKRIRNNREFKVGTKVLYFIGDRKIPNRKWVRKYTGPWIITYKITDGTVIISDKATNNQKRVTIDRLKVFDVRKMKKNNSRYTSNEYEEYITKLKDVLFKTDEQDKNYNTKVDFKGSRGKEQGNTVDKILDNEEKEKQKHKDRMDLDSPQ